MGDNMLGASGGHLAGATASSPTATSGSPRGAAPTSSATRATGRSSTSTGASTSDSGGAGRFRSGNGGEIAYIVAPRRVGARRLHDRGASRRPWARFGGDLGAICNTRVIKGTDDPRALRGGRAAAGHRHAGRRGGPARQQGHRHPMLADDDVLYWNWLRPGGYGDPITRDPTARRAPTSPRARSPPTAADRVYGVVLRDGAATTSRRRPRDRAAVLLRAPRTRPA